MAKTKRHFIGLRVAEYNALDRFRPEGMTWGTYLYGMLKSVEGTEAGRELLAPPIRDKGKP